jgi:ABC-2 type transport system ATP-binding protein
LIFPKRLRALNDVSFEVQPGQVFGLLGPNGAGKTTFIKILLGIIRKTSGQATMLGFPAGSRAGRRLVGYLPEHLRIPPHLTAYTALECYGNLSNVPTSTVRKKRDEYLELVGLRERAKDRVRTYSKGMLQRLGLAQSLLHGPRLLVLDEPTDGLDPRARAEMRKVLRRLKDQGVTIFLNSHILQEVELICDHVAILDRGQLRYSGAVDEIDRFVKNLVGRTGASGIQVDVEIQGDPEAMQRAFQGRNFSIKAKDEETGRVTVELAMEDQPAVDLLIDSLRSAGVSICELHRHQITLEEAFLKIVTDASVG